MCRSETFSSNPQKKGQFFRTLNLSGPEQMAADVILLEKVIADPDISFAFRFYTWKGYWLSIGKNQKTIPEKWLKLFKEMKIKLVRRPSGGNAVLHGGGLTYTFIWLSPPRKRLEAYYLANQWLIKGFYDLGVPLKFGTQSTNHIENNCFATSTNADLVDVNGHKRIGSAQLWRKGHLLQHGEILLDPPAELWTELFKAAPPKPAASSIPRNGLDKLLRKACISSWPDVCWQEKELSQEELFQIKKRAESYSF